MRKVKGQKKSWYIWHENIRKINTKMTENIYSSESHLINLILEDYFKNIIKNGEKYEKNEN